MGDVIQKKVEGRMATISLCMIVKNEEAVLARCLDCLKGLVDEMIIVDTGSTDRTKEIARQYTKKVYDFVWNGNFSDARNFSFSKATMEYIYVADADEIIDKENQKRFWLLKQALLPEVEVVQMKTRDNQMIDIHTDIIVERENHKGIVVGKKGEMLKKIGSRARANIETLLGNPVNLQLWVKTRDNWRDSVNVLRDLGYDEKNDI